MLSRGAPEGGPFEGFVFCLTGLEHGEKGDVQKRIEHLGGKVSPTGLARNATHLVAKHTLHSQKYLAARKMSIPIVRPSFVHDCWAKSLAAGRVDLHQMELLHAVPILYECIISVTGMSSEDRAYLAEMVEANGGTCTPDMTTACTHLVVNVEACTSLRSSPKCLLARKWDIPMVPVAWLYDCISERTCLDASRYRLTQLDRPLGGQQREALPSQEADGSYGSSSEARGATQTFLYDDLTVEEINSVAMENLYFGALQIYVGDHVASDRLAVLRRLILCAGGVRHSDLHDKDAITHFIIHQQTVTEREMELLAQFTDSRPIIVHDQWLFACFYAKELVNITGYAVDFDKIQRAHERISRHQELGPEAVLPSNRGAISIDRPRQVATSWSLKGRPIDGLREGLVKGTPAEDDNAALRVPPIHGNGVAMVGASKPCSSSLPLFSGLFFKVCFEDEPIKAAILVDIIEREGGQIASNASLSPDYIVAHVALRGEALEGHVGGGGRAEGVISRRMVNAIWLDKCVKEGEVIDPQSSIFYRPIAVNPRWSAAHFAPLLIGISGYFGSERDFYGRLIVALGGRFTENLTKRNTHLICNEAAGPKYKFATTFGIICVTARWVVACATRGQLVATSDYAVEGAPVDEAASAKGRGTAAMLAEASSSSRTSQAVGCIPPTTGERVFGDFLLKVGDREGEMAAEKASCPDACNGTLRRDEQLLHRRVGASLKVADGRGRSPPLPFASAAKGEAMEASTFASLPPVLRNCVFGTSQRLLHRQDELNDLVCRLGGTFVWTYDESCTHYLHQGNVEEEAFREFKLVRRHKKYIVSPWWLLACKEARARVPEEDYPHTYSQLASSAAGEALGSAKMGGGGVNDLALVSAASSAREQVPGEMDAPILQIDFDSVIANDRKVARPTIRYDISGITNYAACLAGDAAAGASQAASQPGAVAATVEVVPLPARRRVVALAQLLPDQLVECRRVLSHCSKEDRAVQMGTEWCHETTHLIMGHVSDVPIFWAACAAGIWVLRYDYVEACERAKEWINEEDYEWKASWSDPPNSPSMAPRFWRESVGRWQRHPFAGWRVLLIADEKKRAPLLNVLLAGRAVVTTAARGIAGGGLLGEDGQMMATVELGEGNVVQVRKADDGEDGASPFTHIICSSLAMKRSIPEQYRTPSYSKLVSSPALLTKHLSSTSLDGAPTP